MHRLLPVRKPTGWWSPRLSPRWVRFWTPWRKLLLRRTELVEHVELRGIEHLQQAIAGDQGVLITPNHFTYADPYLLYEAADRVGRPCYVMTAWQVFGMSPWIKQQVLRQHGGFSVDRDSADVRAFRTAVEILATDKHPLVVFPEGEMYRVSERVLPFCEGPAAMALAAARKAKRPVVVVPCALKYYYLDDPTEQLLALMTRLEEALFLRTQPNSPLMDRIYRLSEAALALKELDYVGRTSTGPLPQRLRQLAEFVLQDLEQRYRCAASDNHMARVKALRRAILVKLEELPEHDAKTAEYQRDLDELFFVVQLACYPGDYVSQSPTIERLAETLDKFEEDILGTVFARPRGRRGAIVVFGPALRVEPGSNRKEAATTLTHTLEARVQELLDSIAIPERCWSPNVGLDKETAHVDAT